jgi:ABC-type dipeptide/oligopeptide/nickel transport system ATPase component
VVADEPTAGLDASVKSEVLELMLRAREVEMTWLFVSHELDIVRYVADRVLVMFRGRIVQEMPAADLDPRGDLSARSLHPYCERLLSTAFGAETDVVRPALRPEQSTGCPYLSACHAVDPTSPLWQTCTEAVPHLVQLGGGRGVACHRFTETGTR